MLHAYRATLGFRRQTPALREGTASFLDLPEPVLGVVRATADETVTCLFNLGERPLDLSVAGEAEAAGPVHAGVEGGTVHLPAFGWAFLRGATAPRVALLGDAPAPAPAVPPASLSNPNPTHA